MIKKALQAALLAILPFSQGMAANSPDNTTPIRLLVGFSPGGAIDTVARAVATRLSIALNQQVVVKNKPSAAQRIALRRARLFVRSPVAGARVFRRFQT